MGLLGSFSEPSPHTLRKPNWPQGAPVGAHRSPGHERRAQPSARANAQTGACTRRLIPGPAWQSVSQVTALGLSFLAPEGGTSMRAARDNQPHVTAVRMPQGDEELAPRRAGPHGALGLASACLCGARPGGARSAAGLRPPAPACRPHTVPRHHHTPQALPSWAAADSLILHGHAAVFTEQKMFRQSSSSDQKEPHCILLKLHFYLVLHS